MTINMRLIATIISFKADIGCFYLFGFVSCYCMIADETLIASKEMRRKRFINEFKTL